MTHHTNFTHGGASYPVNRQGALARVKAPIQRWLADRRAKRSRDAQLAMLDAKEALARKSHGKVAHVHQQKRKITHDALRVRND